MSSMIPHRIPGFDTCATHAGKTLVNGEILVDGPLHTFQMDNQTDHRENGRSFSVLEERIATLEGGAAAVTLASANAACSLVCQLLTSPGDELIVATQRKTHPLQMVHGNECKVLCVNSQDIAAIERLITLKTKAIFAESISRCGSHICDIEALSQVACRAQLPLIVDNTIASPYLCRPIEHGADVVIHSAGPFLSADPGVNGGIIVDAGTFPWTNRFYPAVNSTLLTATRLSTLEQFGNFSFAAACRILAIHQLDIPLSPLEEFLIFTGIETLSLRMQRQSDNARVIAEFLASHSAFACIEYAGLSDHQDHGLHLKYCPRGAGPIIKFTLKETGFFTEKNSFLDHLLIIGQGSSVGGAQSKILLNDSSQNRPLSGGATGAEGVDTSKTTMHLYVGIEDRNDIIADLRHALQHIR